MMVHELHDVKYSESKVLVRGEVAVKIFKPSNEEDRGWMNGPCQNGTLVPPILL